MNNDHTTPERVYNALNMEFQFDIDLAASAKNAKTDNFLSAETDSLTMEWTHHGNVGWLNPPYSAPLIARFMEKCVVESGLGMTIVCLVRCDPSARWFRHYVWGKAAEVRFCDHRIRFEGQPGSYPFPNCIVVYRPGVYGKTRVCYWRVPEHGKN